MFTKVLIANRGEISCRIARTARDLGIRTVAVFSEPDRNGLHVEMADEAYCVGPATAVESYLNISKLIEIAQRSGAEAIHPGYGFLSENPEFAEACGKAGLIFIGPPPEVIREMGIKGRAKEVMGAAGISVVSGGPFSESLTAEVKEQILDAGLPVLIKADRGGGGKGIRVVHSMDELEAEGAAAAREALSTFGESNLIWEKKIIEASHIEVQIFRDNHGNCLHLFERDCSLQRRHQKIIEEAPAVNISKDVLTGLHKAAVKAADAIGYVGAGTVEFLVDKNDHFYFLEINTRLQVEHPVTEMITGQDLVHWQFLVANGGVLPSSQNDLSVRGHAIEARIYAEDPAKGFLPATGTIGYLKEPVQSDSVRLDSGIRLGDQISPHYDPILAKLIVCSDDRAMAMKLLRESLSQYKLAGVVTNIGFLRQLAGAPVFTQGGHTVEYVDEYLDELIAEQEVPQQLIAAVAVAWREMEQQQFFAFQEKLTDPYSPWGDGTGFRLNMKNHNPVTLNFAGKDYEVILNYGHGRIIGSVGHDIFELCDYSLQGCQFACRFGDELLQFEVVKTLNKLTVFYDGHTMVFATPEGDDKDDESHNAANSLRAPIPGSVTAVFVTDGQRVKGGDSLLVLEAMKMEYIIRAPEDGVAMKVLYKKGDSVEERARLIEFDGD